MRGSLAVLVLAMAAACGAAACGGDDDGSGSKGNGGDQPYTFGHGGGSGAAAGAGSAGTSGVAGVGAGSGASGGTGSGNGGGGGTRSTSDAGSASVPVAGRGGSAGTGSSVPDSALFVPDVPGTYVGSVIDPGLEIIAHSIEEGPLGHQWLVVLKNVSTDLRLCTASMDTTFLDSAGAEVAVSSLGIVRSPLKRGCSGSCGFMNCMNPGEVGMMVDQNGIEDADVGRIASFTYSFSALDIVDAEPTDDATVTSLEVFTDELGATRYHGLLVNDTSGVLDQSSVYVFGLTAAGRPLLGVSDTNLDDIAGFGSWPFETSRFATAPEDIARVVAFPEVSEP